MINILLGLGFIGCIILAAWSYRDGGSSKGQRWIREVGVGLAEVIAITILFGWNWWSLLILGTVWVETSYFKTKPDAKWYNWALVGLSFALVPLPQVIADGHIWVGFIARTVFIVPFITTWRTFVGNVQWQEGVSGGIQILSLLLMKFIK